jgi:hypothetical protein
VPIRPKGVTNAISESVPLIKQMNAARKRFQFYRFAREAGELGEGLGLTLLDLLILRRGLDVTDPKDIIFGHLGVASDFQYGKPGSLQISVDYSKSYDNVLIEATRTILETSNNLAILQFTDEVKSSVLPSWVTDWRKERKYCTYAYPELCCPIGGVFWDLLKSSQLSFQPSRNGKCQLLLKGIKLNQVREVGSQILHLCLNDLQTKQLETFWSIYTRPSDEWVEGPHLGLLQMGPEGEMGSWKEVRDRNLRAQKLKTESCAAIAGLRDSLDFRRIFMTLVGPWYCNCHEGIGPDLNIDPVVLTALLPIAILGFELHPSIEPEDYEHFMSPFVMEDLEKLYLKDRLQFLKGRRLCLLKYSGERVYDGLCIAVMPESTQVDDVVYYLGGNSVPLVFRKDQTRNVHELVGMCYIYFHNYDYDNPYDYESGPVETIIVE